MRNNIPFHGLPVIRNKWIPPGTNSLRELLDDARARRSCRRGHRPSTISLVIDLFTLVFLLARNRGKLAAETLFPGKQLAQNRE